MEKSKMIVGRTSEIVLLDENNDMEVPTKIDTGADSSAIWASNIKVSDDAELSYSLFAPGSKFYSGELHRTKDFSIAVVRSSHGTVQIRYKVALSAKLSGKTITSKFTLADRANSKFPILIGCDFLENNFLVDVSEGICDEGAKAHKFTDEFKKNPKAFFDKYHLNNERGDLS